MGGKRTLIAKGVYRDKSGIAIVVSVRGKPREFRREILDDGTPGRSYATFTRAELILERKIIDAREHLTTERAIEHEESFAADVQRFLATRSGKHRLNTQGYMAHWEAHFADRQRNTITDLEAQTAFAAIPGANSSKTHIRRALIHFYEVLNGKSGYNPGRALLKPPKDAEEARDLPWSDIEKIFAAMQPSRAKARLMLIAYIGLPHKQIAALQPSDLRLETREVIVHPRRKGAGVRGYAQPLSDAGMAALKEFARVKAFGTFQTQQLVTAFRAAAKRAGVTLPDDAVPYDLRHSFLTEVARSGADIDEIARLGIHATLAQAARYVTGAAVERATKAITSVPRFSATTIAGNVPVRSTLRASRSGRRPSGRQRSRKKKRAKSRGKL